MFFLAAGAARDFIQQGTGFGKLVRCAAVALIGSFAYLAAAVLGLLFVTKPYFSVRAAGRSARCRENLKQLSAALTLYAQDWDDTLPPAPHWGDLTALALRPGTEDSVFRCPSRSSAYGYALSANLAGRPRSEVLFPGHTVMLLEADGASRNAIGGRRSLPEPPPHAIALVALLEGQVRGISRDNRDTVVWSVPRKAKTSGRPVK